MTTVQVDHFSDVLCIWAYVGQVRVDELLSALGERVRLDVRFVSIFGDTPGKIERQWKERGGAAGYGAHVLKVAASFDHIDVHPEIWARNAPVSSMPCHLFLCAVKVLEAREQVAAGSALRACVAMREAFFCELVDVSSRAEQLKVAERLALPTAGVEQALDCGAAHAEFAEGLRLAQEYRVQVSPSLVLDGGRQLLSGNVGYRVIEANARELLDNPSGQASWC